MPSSISQLPGLPGYDSNNLQPWTLQVVISMTVLALLSVGLRLLSRHIKVQKLWWDDWLILFSMVCFPDGQICRIAGVLTCQKGWNLVVVGFIFAMYSCGMGIHADLVAPEDIVMMAKWLVVAEILYAFNLGWTKLSLLLMYYRIFRVPYFKKMAWAVGSFVMAWVICITFLFVFICVPVEKLWYPHLPGRCINQVGTWIANAASTILTDVIILLLPLPPVWRLRLSISEKLGLSAAFGLGSLYVYLSHQEPIIKTVTNEHSVVFTSAYRTSVLFTYAASDPSYTLAPTVGWTAIEMSAGIISACLPTLLPVARVVGRYIGRMWFFGGVYNTTASVFCSRGEAVHGKSRRSRDGSQGSQVSDSHMNPKGKAFYRLSDKTDSDGSGVQGSPIMPVDARLRPDTKGYVSTVKSFKSSAGRDDTNGECVLLEGIHVHTDFVRSTTKA